MVLGGDGRPCRLKFIVSTKAPPRPKLHVDGMWTSIRVEGIQSHVRGPYDCGQRNVAQKPDFLVDVISE